MKRSDIVTGAVAALVLGLAPAMAAAQSITVYSGRGESLVDPLVEQFERDTGIEVRVRYGGTAELAVLLQEEGAASPADVYWAQDGGALGATAKAGLFQELPEDLYAGVPGIYTSATGEWVATTGRARVLAYAPDRVAADEIPESIFDLTDSRYEGRVAWPPSNGSFQANVTGMRVTHGDEATREWLAGMRDNGAQGYPNNTTSLQAVADGEVDFAIVNHYYLLRALAQDPDYPADQTFFADGDIGNMVNVAGVGLLHTADDREAALEFISYLLSPEAQQYFTDEIYEYPVIEGVTAHPENVSLDRLLEAAPALDLDDLDDLEGTLDLLRAEGLL